MVQATNLEDIEWNLISKCKIRVKSQEKIIFISLYAQQVHNCDFIEYVMHQPHYLP